ncbi:MAG: hypothetical protein QW244_01685 [Candidatus Pacearchaeota archaeon]
MKIALVGTHGVGKTTAAHEIVALLKKNSLDAGYLEEVARKCPLPINEETTKESQKWIFYTHLAYEIELKTRYSILVCIDHYLTFMPIISENLAAIKLWNLF